MTFFITYSFLSFGAGKPKRVWETRFFFISKELPTFSSINFKCQQEIEKAKKRPHSITFENFFQKKKVKNSEESDTEATSTSIENVKIN